MSARYVYRIRNTTIKYIDVSGGSNGFTSNFSFQIFTGGSYSIVACSELPDFFLPGSAVVEDDVQFKPMGETISAVTGTIDARKYNYVVCNVFDSGTRLYRSYTIEYGGGYCNYWQISKDGSHIYIHASQNQDGSGNKGEFPAYRGKMRDGSKTIGFSSANTYRAANGIIYDPSVEHNAKFEEYYGSDNIDANSVSYSTAKPERGEPITIIVTPSTGKRFGGTVYYQYEYSIGSGWVKLGAKTTETSKTITIPADAKTFQARVLASDDLGFTSTTYTTGAKLDVQSIQAYIGVNGTARRVTKMYIGVNGVTREVTGGYIGVNGVARTWF